MCETVSWMKEIEHQMSADFANSFAALSDIIAQVQHENNEGFRRCKAVLNRQLVASGTYVPNLRPHNVAMMLKSRFRSPKVVCYVSPDVPEWVLFDDFLV